MLKNNVVLVLAAVAGLALSGWSAETNFGRLPGMKQAKAVSAVAVPAAKASAVAEDESNPMSAVASYDGKVIKLVLTDSVAAQSDSIDRQITIELTVWRVHGSAFGGFPNDPEPNSDKYEAMLSGGNWGITYSFPASPSHVIIIAPPQLRASLGSGRYFVSWGYKVNDDSAFNFKRGGIANFRVLF